MSSDRPTDSPLDALRALFPDYVRAALRRRGAVRVENAPEPSAGPGTVVRRLRLGWGSPQSTSPVLTADRLSVALLTLGDWAATEIATRTTSEDPAVVRTHLVADGDDLVVTLCVTPE